MTNSSILATEFSYGMRLSSRFVVRLWRCCALYLHGWSFQQYFCTT